MDSPKPMAFPYHDEAHVENRSASSLPPRRRRRPSLWDVRTPPYQTVAHPAALSTPPSASAAPDPPSQPSSSSNDIIHVPLPGHEGPLAGINVEALRALLLNQPHAPLSNATENGANPAVSPAPSTAAAVANDNININNNNDNDNGNDNDNDNSTSNINVNINNNQTNASEPTQATEQLPMQATRHARRLYVGNLPSDTTELQIGDFFSRALVASNGSESGEDPVISVYINLDKRFAFIETRTVREAAAGLCLDGVRFREMFLRVRRPNDFVPSGIRNVRPPEGFNPASLSIVSTQVSDGPNKMFIGGIPYSLNEEQVKELLRSYGPLAAFNLIKEPSTGLSKGFAFFEYADGSVVNAACEGLHGTQLGDKTLTVRRATAHVGGAPAVTHASGLARQNGGLASTPLKASELIRASTRVVQLDNLTDANELDDEATFEEVRIDVEEEARLFGKVEEVLLARRPSGQAIIRYATVEEAERAHVTLGGRKFGDRTVMTSFVDEQSFEGRET